MLTIRGKYTLTIFLMLLCIRKSALCQQPPKNFPGIYGALVFNQFSGAGGIEYERYVVTRQKFILGVRGGYLFKYKPGNVNIIYGAKDYITTTNWQFWADGYWFTSSEKQTSGFFINAGLGTTYTHREEKLNLPPPAPAFITSKGVSPGIEAGIGMQMPSGKKNAFKLALTGSLFIPSSKNQSFVPLNMIVFRTSFGF